MGFPWFVFVLAVFPTLFTFAHNYGELLPRAMLLPLLLGVGTAALLMGILFAVRRHWPAAGIATAVLIGWFFSFQIQWMVLQQLPVFPSKPQAIPLTALAAVLLAGVVLWRPRWSEPLVRPLNVFALILVALTGVQLATAAWRASEPSTAPPPGWRPVAAAGAEEDARPRDIYYIILDGYARADVLRELYGYDNSPFLERLEDVGFRVVGDARANYALTFLSLASSLNAQYLDELARRLQGLEGPPARTVPFDMIEENTVMKFLKQRGYATYNLETWWGGTQHLRTADVNVGCAVSTGWEFHKVLLSTTAAYPLRDRLPMLVDDYEVQLCLLEKLLRIHEEPGPKFVFAHILTPHHPAVFSADGAPAEGDPTLLGDENGWANKDGYLGELTFINTIMLRLVETLQAAGEPQPIIVIHSDHGPASSGWENTTEVVRERVPILNALYLPGVDSVPLQELVTPVNTFRFVFSEYLGVRRELLTNNSYFSTPWDPYGFVRVDARSSDLQLTGPVKPRPN